MAFFAVLILMAALFFTPSIIRKFKTGTFASGNGSFFDVSVKASNTKLTARTLHKKINAGWNLGNSLDAHYGEPTGDANLGQETIWGQPKVTKEQIDYVRSLGFNTIRIPVSWYYHSYRDEGGRLVIHPDWLLRVKEVVDYAISNDMYVFLDSHHDKDLVHVGVDSNEFTQITDNVVSMWTQIATYFADYDNRLVFEAYNEVDNYKKYWQYGDLAAKQINELNQTFVNTVRSTGGNNANRVLMVPTLLDGSSGKFLTSFELPKDTASDRLIVTVHLYAQGFDQSVSNYFSELEDFSNRINAPVIIGEWGTTDQYTPAEFRTIQASNYVARAEAHNIKCIYWDNGSDYAIVDRINLTANKEMVKAILKPKAYTSDGRVIGNKFSDYAYMTLDQTTGELIEDKHWGTIILDSNGKGFPVQEGASILSIQLVRSGNMSGQSIHYVYFYGSDGKLLSCINDWNGFIDKTVVIPEGTATFRVGINSATSATTKEQYENAFKNGTLAPVIRFID